MELLTASIQSVVSLVAVFVAYLLGRKQGKEQIRHTESAKVMMELRQYAVSLAEDLDHLEQLVARYIPYKQLENSNDEQAVELLRKLASNSKDVEQKAGTLSDEEIIEISDLVKSRYYNEIGPELQKKMSEKVSVLVVTYADAFSYLRKNELWLTDELHIRIAEILDNFADYLNEHLAIVNRNMETGEAHATLKATVQSWRADTCVPLVQSLDKQIRLLVGSNGNWWQRWYR